ncbi:MAG: signal peptide peptidase SppA [Phycisphaeraceae bacterium]|nr:signal peptide peptidase SppA [Phycisphaeraceae bacterium]MCW5763307.1 signal peptide peptidase SppA [Phycisphaeraceae bacterium]
MSLITRSLACVAGLVSQVAVSGAAAQPVGLAWLELSGTPTQQPGPFAWLGGSEGDTLRSLVERIDEVAYHDDIEGLVIRLKDAALDVTHIEELGQAMLRIREAGKKIHVFAENYANPELLLGSFADSILIQSGGNVSLSGLHMEEMYLRDTFTWIGMNPDYVQIGDYKGADEMMMKTQPSPAWEQNISGLLDAMYGTMRQIIMDGRNMDDQQLDRAMSDGWWANEAEAISLGLIDAAVDLPTIYDHLETIYGSEVEFTLDLNDDTSSSFDMANPFAFFSILSKKPSHTATSPTIAILHIDGAIVDGESSSGGFLGGSSVGSRTIRNAIEDILEQDMIKGVVVRIDSPGGSAIASEVIWQGLQRLAEEKPVWVSVGSMAASGGYYIAVGGQRIYANPSSIVGSIGVVGGKIAMGGLYDKLHINVVERSRGPRSELLSSTRPWSDVERALIRDRMKQTYDQFTSRVSSGRPGIDLGRTAEGRLFLGEQALDLNMIDAIGGLDDAIHELAADLDLDDFEIMDFPGPKSITDLIDEMLGGFVKAPAGLSTQATLAPIAGTLRELLGERRFEVLRDAINANMQLRREPVLLTSPRVLLFR